MNQVSALLTSPVASGLGLLIGLAALVSGYIFYRRGKREKRPQWVVVTTNVVGKAGQQLGESLSVHYRHRAISTVSISKIALWNAGKQTIDKADIPPGDRLRISTTDAAHRILEVRVIGHNSEGNQFATDAVSDDGATEVPINFEFMDRNDGAVFQVLHTGVASTDITLRGTFKGARRLREVPALTAFMTVLPRQRSTVLWTVGVIVVLAGLFVGLLATHFFRTVGDFIALVAVAVAPGFLFVIGPLTAWRSGYFPPDNLRGFLRD